MSEDIETIECFKFIEGLICEPFCTISVIGEDGKYELSIGGENTIKVDFPYIIQEEMSQCH